MSAELVDARGVHRLDSYRPLAPNCPVWELECRIGQACGRGRSVTLEGLWRSW
jgi:hypothetical protein